MYPDPDVCPDKVVGYSARLDGYGRLVHDGENGYAGSRLVIRFSTLVRLGSAALTA